MQAAIKAFLENRSLFITLPVLKPSPRPRSKTVQRNRPTTVSGPTILAITFWHCLII